jgi:deoxyribose-phosphate aldolase
MPSVTLQAHGQKIRVPHYPVDMVMVEERASSFTKRSIKTQSKMDALYLAIEMMDLTTLEGMDTEGKVRQLCAKARNPLPADFPVALKRPVPCVGAVCVYPSMVRVAKEALSGTSINIASVATSFPSGQLDHAMKVREVQKAVKDGATEIDMVINRGDFLSGRYQTVFDEIRAVKEACGEAHLKVILETGELKTYDKVRLASTMAMEAGADFIKTSTGKVTPAATMPVTLVMLQAIWDYYQDTGKKIGMKPAGGIRTAKQAVHYLVMVNEVMGSDWLTPDLFRFGASALLNDVLRQIVRGHTGSYVASDLFSLE